MSALLHKKAFHSFLRADQLRTMHSVVKEIVNAFGHALCHSEFIALDQSWIHIQNLTRSYDILHSLQSYIDFMIKQLKQLRYYIDYMIGSLLLQLFGGILALDRSFSMQQNSTQYMHQGLLWQQREYNAPYMTDTTHLALLLHLRGWSIRSSLTSPAESALAKGTNSPSSDEAQASLTACTTCCQRRNFMSWLQHLQGTWQGTRTTSIALRKVISVRVAACGGIKHLRNGELYVLSSWQNDGSRQLSLDKGSTRLR